MEGVGFVSGGAALPGRNVAPARCARTVVSMGAKSVENRERRVAIIDQVKKHLDESTLAFCVPLAGYSVKEISGLRQAVPESTNVMAVKNTLFKRAVADTQWEVAGSIAKGSNVWFFVGEEMKETVESLKKYNKSVKKDDTNDVVGGSMEGVLYDTKGVDALSKLPSKQDLYQKIAIAINSVPTKLGVSVKAVPTKLGRAVKLAVATEPSE